LNIDTFPFAGIVLKVNPEEFNLLQLNPVELAKQMTLLEHQHFQAIAPLEFLQKNFTKPAKSPNFHLMVAKFNQWSSWATTEILKRETPQQRAEIIGHFITIAQVIKPIPSSPLSSLN
jgi:son of sevenless-like protein